MPKKRNLRLETYNKLRMIKKSNSTDVIKLKLEDLERIIDKIQTNTFTNKVPEKSLRELKSIFKI